MNSQSRSCGRNVQIAIVVLAYGGNEKVTELLSHLRPATITAAHELIVVHNPSTSKESLASHDFNAIRVIELSTNRGYVGGMNAGIDVALQSKPEFVLLLTHDVRIAANKVQELQALINSYPDLAAIGPILCGHDRVPYSAGFIRNKRVHMHHRIPNEEMPNPIWPCDAIDGSVMMWRAAALEEVRGFDKRFFMYFEDVDICTRATRCGWRIAVATNLYAVSARGGSQRRRAHAYLRARNGLAYARTFGTAGLLSGLAECAIGLWRETPKPGGHRFQDAKARQFALTYWRGTLLGVVDYFRGRWGPPPQRILRDTDIAATSL